MKLFQLGRILGKPGYTGVIDAGFMPQEMSVAASEPLTLGRRADRVPLSSSQSRRVQGRTESGRRGRLRPARRHHPRSRYAPVEARTPSQFRESADSFASTGTILQPRCTILAVSGPIIFGENNIVEENVIIVNRHKQPMLIGDFNLFEVGSRTCNPLFLQTDPPETGSPDQDDKQAGVESPSVGSHNVFGIRSRVLPSVSVGSHCVVGAGCLVQADPFAAMSADHPSTLTSESTGDVASESGDVPSNSATEPESAATRPPATPSTAPPTTSDSLADYTHVFGSENRQRKATSEGGGQAKALFAKHWEYLRDTLPRYHKLKMF